MKVDLPAPLSPTRPTTSPALISRLTLSTAVRPPKRLVRFAACKRGVMSISSLPQLLAELIHDNGEDHHCPDRHKLPEGTNAQHNEAVLDGAEDKRAEN